ncbi:MAG: universal stress protein [Chloroflexota bacterium]|nr:universal stress protein [Chloroflexota bacterium]
MFQRILVPLDGSTRAEQALPVAARLAHASSGTIVLVQVVNFPNQFASYIDLEPLTTQAVVDTQLEEAKNYLDNLTRSNDLTNVHTETAVMVGQPAVHILSVVETRTIDLVVMGSHGYTGMTRWVLVLQSYLACERASGARSPIRRYELPFSLPSRLTSLLAL